LFPRLAEREDQLAGTMSGGEQQMLALGYVGELIEKLPSAGLKEILMKQLLDTLKELGLK
jgi:branched-chain amino acid transport system ATP-binding protein